MHEERPSRRDEGPENRFRTFTGRREPTMGTEVGSIAWVPGSDRDAGSPLTQCWVAALCCCTKPLPPPFFPLPPTLSLAMGKLHVGAPWPPCRHRAH
eukprot:3821731-Amphidinium_carterae.1